MGQFLIINNALEHVLFLFGNILFILKHGNFFAKQNESPLNTDCNSFSLNTSLNFHVYFMMLNRRKRWHMTHPCGTKNVTLYLFFHSTLRICLSIINSSKRQEFFSDSERIFLRYVAKD